MKQIEINGLLWDAENLEIEGKKYFTWQEAMEAANSVGKRLPTKEELEAIVDTSYEFDHERKGMWFADNKLFFPLSGCICYVSGPLSYTEYGFLWSSYYKDSSNSWSLYFTESVARMSNSCATCGFPVRCVQDIESDNLIIDKNNMEKTYSQWKSASCEPPEDMQIVFVKVKSKNLLAGLGIGYKLPGRMAFEVGDDIISYEEECSDVFWTEVPR